MFWPSVYQGLGAFLHWQTFVVALMYLAISFLPSIAIMFAGDKTGNLSAKGGCLFIIFQSVLQTLAVFISVCTLFPIMLGKNDAAWSLPWTILITASGTAFGLMARMLVLAVIGGIIPILGRANSFIMLIAGHIVLVFLTRAMDVMHPEFEIGNVVLFPSWGIIIGIVIVSGLTSWLGVFAAAALITAAEKMPVFRNRTEIGQLLMLPLSSVFGFIPIFIDGAWIALQIKAGI